MALPATLLIIAFVTVMLATAFVRVQADRRIAESSGDLVDALAVAQSGLQTYFATASTFDACEQPSRPPDGDSVRINVTGGYADVVAHVVRKPADTMTAWTYIVRSTGRVIEPALGADPQAVRTVAQFAEWQRVRMTTPAVFTAANGFTRLGGIGEFKGNDHTGASCATPIIGAMMSPVAEQPSSYAGYSITGAVMTDADGPTTAAGTGIDWNGTITRIVPDYTTVMLGDASYPIMRVTGAATISGSTASYGALIVTGDLTFSNSSSLRWSGVLLVGGRIIFSNTAEVHVDGLVASGLNEQLGVSPPTTGIGATDVKIHYDSREIRRSFRAVAGWVPVQNAWVDNWATY